MDEREEKRLRDVEVASTRELFRWRHELASIFSRLLVAAHGEEAEELLAALRSALAAHRAIKRELADFFMRTHRPVVLRLGEVELDEKALRAVRRAEEPEIAKWSFDRRTGVLELSDGFGISFRFRILAFDDDLVRALRDR